MTALMNMPLPRAYPVGFSVVLEGNNGPAKPVQKAIGTALGWKALFGSTPMPMFDAKHETLVVIALGQRPSAGFRVRVKSVTREIGGFVGLLDTVRWQEVKPTGPANDVLTRPFCAFICAIARSRPVFDP